MVTLITFIVSLIIFWIFTLLDYIEFDMVLILSLLVSACVSIPYYSNKILKALNDRKEDKKE